MGGRARVAEACVQEIQQLRREFYQYYQAGVRQKDVAARLGLNEKYFCKLVNGSAACGPAGLEHLRKAVAIAKENRVLTIPGYISLEDLSNWCTTNGINRLSLSVAEVRKLLEGKAYVRSSV